MDFIWRWRAARHVREWGAGRILDLATGSGDLALTLLKACPGVELVAADFCAEMLEVARRKGVPNTVVADGLALPFENGSFDGVTVAFGLRNMASWDGALAEMYRVLRPGGHVLVLDFALPKGPLRWVYRKYLHHVLPRLAGWVTGRKAAYDYLGESIEKFPSGAAMRALMEGVGFREVKCEALTGGVVGLYVGRRH